MSKICFLIHGYLTDYRDFCGLPNKIMSLYDQVILYQIPGHNHKSCLRLFTMENTFNSIDNEMKKIIDGNEVDVIGFSLGGALAIYIASTYPIHKLVLLSPAIKYFNHHILLDRTSYIRKIKKDEKAIFYKNSFNAIDFTIHNTLPKFNLANGITFCKIIDKINRTSGRIHASVLIIRGRLDELVPQKVITECINRIDNSNVKVYNVDGIGHMMLRTPKGGIIIKKVKDFLEEKDNEGNKRKNKISC